MRLYDRDYSDQVIVRIEEGGVYSAENHGIFSEIIETSYSIPFYIISIKDKHQYTLFLSNNHIKVTE